MSKKTVRRGKTLQKTEKQEAATSAAETEPRPAAHSRMLSLTLFEIGEIENMKRAQLQKLCKKVGLKASGKVGVTCAYGGACYFCYLFV